MADVSFQVGEEQALLPEPDVRFLAELVREQAIVTGREMAGSLLGDQLELAASNFDDLRELRLSERQYQLVREAIDKVEVGRAFFISPAVRGLARTIREFEQR
jgi:hypothetical protein